MEAPVRPHRRLKWKYTGVVVALVAAAVVSLGLTELYFSYQDTKRALTGVERDKAFTAATSIEQLMQELVLELESVAQPTTASGAAGLDEWQQDFNRLLGREDFFSQLEYLDAAGREQVRDDPARGRPPRQRDRPLAERRVPSERGRRSGISGPSTSRTGSQPHMTIAVAERAPGRGVVVADVDLSFVPEVVERARTGTAGYAYAVDSKGVLVAHPDTDLLLRHTNMASLPQVQAALRGRGQDADARDDRTRPGRDEGPERVPDDRLARLARLRRGAAERGLRAARVGDLAHRDPARRLPPARERDRRPARAPARSADRVDPGRSREDRLRRPRPADRHHEPRRARRARGGVQPHGRAARGVLREPRAEGRRADAGACGDARAARREEPRARDGEPPQVAVPGEHVARAADAAERDPRLLAALAR